VCVFRSIRVQFRIDARLVREVGDDTTRITAYFWSESLILSEGIDFDAIVMDFNSQLDNFNSRGSGFCLERLTRCVVSVVKFRPLAGNSYTPHTQLIEKEKMRTECSKF